MPAFAEFAVDSPLFSRAFAEATEGVSSPSRSDPRPGDSGASLEILLVACGADLKLQLRQRLLRSHWLLREAASGSAALSMLEQQPSDIVLLASSLPDLDVTEFQQLVREQFPSVQVLGLSSLLGAPGQKEVGSSTAVAPIRSPSLLTCSQAAVPGLSANPPHENSSYADWQGIVGASPAMLRVFRAAAMVARRDTTVLIGGESGTGKDMLARGIHNSSPRSRQPFVVINCAAIPEALLEAELFGHTKGAFTGASQARVGRVHAAHGGTLFLDEIGDMPLPLQSKILRFLEQGEVQRIGSTDTHRVDCRIVAATNADLREQVKARQFREDLFYRLAVMPLAVPPLRERMSDMPALCAAFLERFCAGSRLGPGALDALMQHSWPGNVRELRNVMERASLFAEGRHEISVEEIVL